MKTCNGCGGVLGRDCWNEHDCIQISQSMNSQDQQHVNQLDHELSWERNVVVPDLERKLEIALVYINDLSRSLYESEFLSTNDRRVIEESVNFYNENKGYIKTEAVKNGGDDLPF